MQSEDLSKEPSNKFAFIAYGPKVTPLPGSQGGGFKVTLDVSEDQWERIKDMNDPALAQLIFSVALVGQVVK